MATSRWCRGSDPADDEHYDRVSEVLDGERSGVVTLPMTPGTLLVFEGRHSLHRVSPVHGALRRHVGLLAFDTVAGTQGSELLREARYGRTVPFEIAARGVAGLMTEFVTEFGESFVGSGADAAHINTVLGAKGGPVETAWTTALATPREGHAAFVTILRPGIPAKPMTLFVNKSTVSEPKHSGLTWGPAQAGVASGVMWAVADGVIEATLVDELLLICAVWVSPEAGDEGAIYAEQPRRHPSGAGVGKAPHAHVGRGDGSARRPAERVLPASGDGLTTSLRVQSEGGSSGPA